ncbi:MAG: hypothetical protein HQ559_01145 [Lentisphaerae bacterium]|nr:hypothetical protein [Lentisphaerota bacterium]
MDMDPTAEPSPEPVPSAQATVCHECKQHIARGARKCHHCGSCQGRWHPFQHIPVAVSVIMVSIAIFQVLLAYEQTRETRKQRQSADEALQRVESDAKAIADLRLEIERKLRNIDKRIIWERDEESGDFRLRAPEETVEPEN